MQSLHSAVNECGFLEKGASFLGGGVAAGLKRSTNRTVAPYGL